MKNPLTKSRRPARAAEPPDFDDEPAVVTYARIDPKRPRTGPARDERIEPEFVGVEVPYVDPPSPVRPAADDDDFGFADDLVDPPARRRSRPLLIVAATGLVAVVAGVGVLAATFGSATRDDVAAIASSESTDASTVAAEMRLLRDRIDELSASASPSDIATQARIAELEARLAELERGSGISGVSPDIRTIPITGAESESTTASAAASASEPLPAAPPPVPRPRPEPPAATSAGEPTLSASTAPTDDAPAATTSPAPVESARAAPATAGDDAFISSIEETLASIRSNPDAAASAPAAATAPATTTAPTTATTTTNAPASAAPPSTSTQPAAAAASSDLPTPPAAAAATTGPDFAVADEPAATDMPMETGGDGFTRLPPLDVPVADSTGLMELPLPLGTDSTTPLTTQ